MAKTASQATEWAAQKIASMGQVHGVEVLDSNAIRVTREPHAPFVAGIVSFNVVTRDGLKPLWAGALKPEMAVNLPKIGVWTAEAIAFAADQGASFGGISDLMIAVGREETVPNYVNREYTFVERGMHQHSRVLRVERVWDRVYKVSRRDLSELTVAFLNEYELTAERVRDARTRYGQFDTIVMTNPNGRATSRATEVATQIGAPILDWGGFLGRLNRK